MQKEILTHNLLMASNWGIESGDMTSTSVHSQSDLLHNDRDECPNKEYHEIKYEHLKERFFPSHFVFLSKVLSPSATSAYMCTMGYFFFLLVFRFIYMRIINFPNDIVSLLMINILAQMGVELFSKLYIVYGGEAVTVFYKQTQLVFGWKSVCLIITLTFCCAITIKGTISDFPLTYHHDQMIQMAAWRSCLTVFCFLLSNENTYMAHMYYETFFTLQNSSGVTSTIYLTSFVDRRYEGDVEAVNNATVIEKSSKAEILNRVKELMPTFVLIHKVMKLKSMFNLLNSAIFFILSLGVIGHSENNGMFYYNIFMIVIMSTISYTSFETISRFNSVLDSLDLALDEVRLHLHVRVSSYAVDDRFLTVTTGAAFLQVVLKIFGIS